MRDIITLACTECKRRNYSTTKNRKKTSERLIVEMRDKIKKFDDKTGSHPADPKDQSLASDAVSAMINLGYNAAQAQKAIKTAMERSQSPNLAGLITAALRLV